MSTAAAAAAAKQAITNNNRILLRRKVLTQMAAGVGVMAVPVCAWWYWAKQERFQIIQEAERTKVRLPSSPRMPRPDDTYDYLISEKCQAGDVVLFDRRCERCAASPWAALACIVSKQCLTNNIDGDNNLIRSVDSGSYDHIGLIVPGYVTTKADAYDPSNLLLLEATPSGVVARPLKERLEQSASNSVLLLQLCSPGEQRNVRDDDDDDKPETSAQKVVHRTRHYVERELANFRDQWIQAGAAQNYRYIHSTVTLGGALAYQCGLTDIISGGPVSPSAFLVLCGLQKAAAAPNLSDKDNRAVKPEDFLRDYRFTDQDAVRLRPGWRFLAPLPLKQGSSSSASS